MEKEEKWLTYDDYESVVNFEISDLLFAQLVDEATKDLANIQISK